ncbi:MAG: proton-conducting transporter membrane subunit [Phycisphaerales bacterium]|nr:proton-conducting transporter membrane subunit [Phycisphaerales bacterium]
MNWLLQIFIWIPFVGFVLSLLINGKNEKRLSLLAIGTVGLQLFLGFGYVIYWVLCNHPNVNLKDIVIYRNQDYEFLIDFYFDKITATYMLVGAALSFMVILFSRYYLHREEGYKRFFNTILFFYTGYNITIFSGNFETLFIGWEILGISSFLLIAFYRNRFLPVKNAMKVFSVYRLGDIGLILTMWMSHHLWHENISFMKLNNYELVHEHLNAHSYVGIFISIMILIAAAAKSAQLPFSSWLPRAMEGPTPSSAIFYGSLSVHIGVFLLLRTFPFWENQTIVRGIIILLGLSTMFIATGIARVQSSVKSQIAYASIGQIGIIFIEVALGFEKLALFHFAGNAFLRTYQLLVSPSVVSYLIREQFYNYTPHKKSFEARFPKKLQNTLYILCIKEWNLDTILYNVIWNPLKKAGRRLTIFTPKTIYFIFFPSYLLGLLGMYHKDMIPTIILSYLPIFFAFTGLAMVLQSFAEKKSIIHTWLLIVMSHFWIAMAIGYNDIFDLSQIYLYLSGIFVSGVGGYYILRRMQQLEPDSNLSIFHGHVYEYPIKAFLFLLACLGLTGFPITPTFIGEDLLFSHMHQHQILLATFISLCFVIDGLSIIRVFARVFYGSHVKTYHEVAYRSS